LRTEFEAHPDMMCRLCCTAVLLATIAVDVSFTWADEAETGILRFLVKDAHGEPSTCRFHLSNQNDKSVRPPNRPFWHDHFVGHGTIELELPIGKYQYTVQRGPEYADLSGTPVDP
jgi:hypothetical protein